MELWKESHAGMLVTFEQFSKVKVLILRLTAYANYADGCFPCRTDYANTLLLSCCLHGLRGTPGL